MKKLSLNDGNQNELIYYSDCKKGIIDRCLNDNNWDNYDIDDNPYTRLIDLIDDHSNAPNSFTGFQDFEDYWLKLNRCQKIIWLFGMLNVYVNSVIIDEFFYNFKPFIFAVIEILGELGLTDELEAYREELYYFIEDSEDKELISFLDTLKQNIVESNIGLLDERNMKKTHIQLFKYVSDHKQLFFK
ncbi:hypothetical protein [Flammeovirga sp. OC4]|uniref:hypothetical protein n=1 Tax=Flammeovirga sp. OC4 TaxID=1382345 RepID=UPI0005C71300|nr:hypothetical protein [Flammeovirga sp. OC4]